MEGDEETPEVINWEPIREFQFKGRVTLTIVAIVLWSATVASVIPMVLRRFRIDPAVVSAPFIATLVDGTGLIIYFEIAKLILPDLQ